MQLIYFHTLFGPLYRCRSVVLDPTGQPLVFDVDITDPTGQIVPIGNPFPLGIVSNQHQHLFIDIHSAKKVPGHLEKFNFHKNASY